MSLDVFRGLTIAAMVLVNSPGNESSYGPLEHAPWHGWTLTDLVFPFFVFIVGVSLVYSFSKRLEQGATTETLFLPLLKRTLLLFGLGLLLNGFPAFHLATWRIPGVLQRIALCYFFGSILYLTCRTETLCLVAGLLLVQYWLVMSYVQVPAYGYGLFTREGNVVAYIDRELFGNHLYRQMYDPEGLLSTLPAIATVLSGVLTGVWLRAPRSSTEKLYGMVILGTALVIGGEAWAHWFPINKALWTSSYVLLTSGLALYVFALCYWLFDMRQLRRWAEPFQVFGLNAIAIYVLHIFFLKIQNRIHIHRPNGQPGNLRFFITDHLFGSWASPEFASLLYALGYTMFWWWVFRELYRRKIFIKV